MTSRSKFLSLKTFSSFFQVDTSRILRREIYTSVFFADEVTSNAAEVTRDGRNNIQVAV